MEYKIGDVVTGTIAGVQPYGAFVKLDDETQGLIHISECTDGYVSSVKELLNTDEKVTVKVLDIDEYTGKISLSLRVLNDAPVAEDKASHRKHFWTDRSQKIGFKSIAEKKSGWIKEAIK